MKYIYLFCFIGFVVTQETFTCPTENAENNPHGHYANPNDCSTFWQCSNGHPYLMPCAEGTYFSSVTLNCEWREDSDCPLMGIL